MAIDFLKLLENLAEAGFELAHPRPQGRQGASRLA